MTKAFNRIELIMTPHGASALRSAVHRAYVWVVHSDENRAAFESTMLPKDSLTLSIMTEDAPQSLEGLLELAIEHHGYVAEIGVVGYANEDEADACLGEFGYSRQAVDGLEYRRIADAPA
jgi:hypothetical protein